MRGLPLIRFCQGQLAAKGEPAACQRHDRLSLCKLPLRLCTNLSPVTAPLLLSLIVLIRLGRLYLGKHTNVENPTPCYRQANWLPELCRYPGLRLNLAIAQ